MQKDYKLMKVFDIQKPRAPQDVRDVSHILNNDLWGNGNDSYYHFEVVENPAEEQGLGYITATEAKVLTAWLIERGAEIGETVLIKHWW